MGEIVNLRRAKKAKGRAANEKQAAANRTNYGTPKKLRAQAEAEKRRVDERIDAHRLDDEN